MSETERDEAVVRMLADLLPGWDGTPGHLRLILSLFGIEAPAPAGDSGGERG